METGAPRQKHQATPADFVRSMIRAPVVSTSGSDWDRLTLERFQVPSLSLDLGPSSVHRLTLHLAGPVEIVRTRDGYTERKWSDQGRSNLVPAGEPTVRSFEGEADFMIAYLVPSLVDDVVRELYNQDPTRFRLSETLAMDDPVVGHIGSLLMDQVAVTKPGQRMFNDTLSRALVLHLIRTYGTTALPSLPAMGKLAPWRVKRVMDYMHANLADHAPLSKLASLVGLGPVQFTRAFRLATGVPPHEYLLRLRISHAIHLLETTSLPVTEVGLCCGFDQPSHFGVMFRKRIGFSPSAYRNSRR